MLDDFVVVTITRPGPLYVRLKPDPRGLVVVNNFDKVPDDPETGCPRLGPVENVGTVMPGDCLVSSFVLSYINLSKSLQVAACDRLMWTPAESSAATPILIDCIKFYHVR